MPTLRFQGVKKETLHSLSNDLFDALTDIYSVPDDYINIQFIESEWLTRTGTQAGYPMVEVLAFKRADAIEQQVATAVSKLLNQAGYPEVELYFIHLTPKHYYCNAASCE